MSGQEFTIGSTDARLHPYGAGHSVANENHPTINNDNFLVSYNLGTYAVFDGVGEDAGAHEAAGVAVSSVYEHYNNQQEEIVTEAIAYGAMKHALLRAHINIQKDDEAGRTTAAAVNFFENEDGNARVSVGHVGDSRVYRLRSGWRIGSLTLDDAGFTKPLSPDDAWKVQDRFADVTNVSTLTSQERSMFRRRNLITSSGSLGTPGFRSPRSTVQSFDVQADDRFVLTTDGIHDNLTTDEIHEIVSGTFDPSQAASELITAAQDRSRSNHMRAKPDDMTAVVVNVPAKS